jgi:AraC family transcriptional regulator of adaptative response / DNA-3-methyladenine glycosylase II
VNLAAKLVAEHGEALQTVCGDGLTHIFPTPDRIAQANLLGMPAARARALSSVAAAASANPNFFSPSQTLEDAIAKLRSIRGIGEWTAQYIAMRVLREPDAFPATDIGLLRALARSEGGRPSTAEVVARAEAWRPWRAYAAQHLWTVDARTVRANKRINLKDNVDGHPSNAADPVHSSSREHDRNITSHP